MHSRVCGSSNQLPRHREHKVFLRDIRRLRRWAQITSIQGKPHSQLSCHVSENCTSVQSLITCENQWNLQIEFLFTLCFLSIVSASDPKKRTSSYSATKLSGDCYREQYRLAVATISQILVNLPCSNPLETLDKSAALRLQTKKPRLLHRGSFASIRSKLY